MPSRKRKRKKELPSGTSFGPLFNEENQPRHSSVTRLLIHFHVLMEGLVGRWGSTNFFQNILFRFAG